MADLEFQSTCVNTTEVAPTKSMPKHLGSRPVVQYKLVVGASDDPYEREADSIADRVVAHLESPQDQATAHRVMTSSRSRISRKAAVIGSAGGSVDEDTERAIKSSSGKPVEPLLRRRMEGAFGTDFGGIRVHVGSRSNDLNERVQSRAFTTGSNVFIRQQDYAPNTKTGDRLIAHELAHTVQQGGAGAQRSVQRSSDTIQRLFGFGQKKATAPTAATTPTPTAATTPTPTAAATTKGSLATGRSTNVGVLGGKSTGKANSGDDLHGSVNESGEATTGLLGSTGVVTDIDGYRDDVAKSTGGKDAVGSDKSGAGTEDTAKLGIASGSGDIANMFIGISKAVKIFADKDKSAADKVGAGLEMTGSIAAGGKGVGGIVKGSTTTKEAADGMAGAKDASIILSGITDSINAVKEGFFIVKGIIELAKDAAGMSDEEKFKASMDIVRRSLEAAKSVVSTVKTFLDMCGSGVTSAMVNTIPGLGIAIGCAELVVRGVDLVMSLVHSSRMKESKREIKTAMGGAKGTSMKSQADEWLKTGTPDQKVQAHEYLTAKSLQYVNDKRTRRALLKIAVAMTKIAGDAATLGGVSAPVGIGLKVGAVAVDIGAGIFRKFKQWARDKVAEGEKTNTSGKPGLLAKVFNLEKTTEKKTLEYNRVIDNVLDMIVAAAPANATAVTPVEEKKMLKVEHFVSAMGFSMAQLDRESAKGGENLYKKMLEALKKRE